MRVVLTDPILDRFREELTRAGADGHDWAFLAELPDAAVAAELPTADVLVASRVTAPMAEAASRLRLLHVTGAGVDRIALGSLRATTAVCTTAHHGPSMAEHVVMVTLMLSRRVLRADRLMREGRGSRWRSTPGCRSAPRWPAAPSASSGSARSAAGWCAR